MTAAVEFSDDARRMLDDADELWIAEHGYLAANPLVVQAERATEQLADDPELGKHSDEREATNRKSVACCSQPDITSTTTPTPEERAS